MLSHIGYDKLVSCSSIHKIHIVDFCDRFYPMRLFKRLSLITINIKDFCLWHPIPSENYFLYHHGSWHRRYLSLLFIVPIFEKDNIRQYTKEQYLQHSKQGKFKTDLCRSLKLIKRPRFFGKKFMISKNLFKVFLGVMEDCLHGGGYML